MEPTVGHREQVFPANEGITNQFTMKSIAYRSHGPDDLAYRGQPAS
jgi:hypothetical protein